MRATLALRQYFLKHLADGHLKGSNTVLGRLLEYSTGGGLTDNQLFYIAILLLIAGNETTTNPVLINGSIEAALGLALLNSRTRRAALAATIAYLTYFNASLPYRQRVLHG